MELLSGWDTSLLLWVNQTWTSPWGDAIARFFSARETWWTIGLLAIALTIVTRKRKHAMTLLLVALSVGASDLICARWLKPSIARLRPCQQMMLHIPEGCGSQYGYPSNHSANGAAVVGVLALRMPGPWTFTAAALAFLVGLSRVYLGVHFPTDVVSGFALGAFLGVLITWIARPRPRTAPPLSPPLERRPEIL